MKKLKAYVLDSVEFVNDISFIGRQLHAIERQLKIRLQHLYRSKQLQQGIYMHGMSKILYLLNLFEE